MIRVMREELFFLLLLYKDLSLLIYEICSMCKRQGCEPRPSMLSPVLILVCYVPDNVAIVVALVPWLAIASAFLLGNPAASRDELIAKKWTRVLEVA